MEYYVIKLNDKLFFKKNSDDTLTFTSLFEEATIFKTKDKEELKDLISFFKDYGCQPYRLTLELTPIKLEDL